MIIKIAHRPGLTVQRIDEMAQRIAEEHGYVAVSWLRTVKVPGYPRAHEYEALNRLVGPQEATP